MSCVHIQSSIYRVAMQTLLSTKEENYPSIFPPRGPPWPAPITSAWPSGRCFELNIDLTGCLILLLLCCNVCIWAYQYSGLISSKHGLCGLCFRLRGCDEAESADVIMFSVVSYGSDSNITALKWNWMAYGHDVRRWLLVKPWWDFVPKDVCTGGLDNNMVEWLSRNLQL